MSVDLGNEIKVNQSLNLLRSIAKELSFDNYLNSDIV